MNKRRVRQPLPGPRLDQKTCGYIALVNIGRPQCNRICTVSQGSNHLPLIAPLHCSPIGTRREGKSLCNSAFPLKSRATFVCIRSTVFFAPPCHLANKCFTRVQHYLQCSTLLIYCLNRLPSLPAGRNQNHPVIHKSYIKTPHASPCPIATYWFPFNSMLSASIKVNGWPEPWPTLVVCPTLTVPISPTPTSPTLVNPLSHPPSNAITSLPPPDSTCTGNYPKH